MDITKIKKKDVGEDAPGEHVKCTRCNVPLEKMEAHITYLDRHFSHKVPRCPRCGQVFITEEIADGKMAQLEKSLEEK